MSGASASGATPSGASGAAGAAGAAGSADVVMARSSELPHAGLRVPVRRGFLASVYSGNVSAVFMRGLRVIAKSTWLVILTGFFEPVFYLASMGIGMGALIGDVTFHGEPVSYGAFIAPALLATSAMNGAVYDSTMNVFFKLHYGKVYDGMLATSLGPLDVTLGEIGLALFRGLIYAAGFLGILVAFGLVTSWTAVFALPAVLLIAFGFASIGFACTSFITNWNQLDLVSFVMLPMFLLSGTFFPLEVYPVWAQAIIQALPLWHGVDMLRQLTTGIIDWTLALHVSYYLVLAIIAVIVATRRIRKLFLR